VREGAIGNDKGREKKLDGVINEEKLSNDKKNSKSGKEVTKKYFSLIITTFIE
jgi:hypothetical protein